MLTVSSKNSVCFVEAVECIFWKCEITRTNADGSTVKIETKRKKERKFISDRFFLHEIPKHFSFTRKLFIYCSSIWLKRRFIYTFGRLLSVWWHFFSSRSRQFQVYCILSISSSSFLAKSIIDCIWFGFYFQAEEQQRKREATLRQHVFFQLRIHLISGHDLKPMDKNGMCVNYKPNAAYLVQMYWSKELSTICLSLLLHVSVSVCRYQWSIC